MHSEPAQLAYERDVLGYQPQAIAGCDLPGAGVAVLHCERVDAERKYGYADYHTLTLQLGNATLCQLDRRGRAHAPMETGTVAIQPADAETTWHSFEPTRWMQFYLPTATFDESLAARGLAPGTVRLARHAPVDDSALVSLLYRCAVATARMPGPDAAARDALSTALADLLAERYSSRSRRIDVTVSERLSPRQLDTALAYIDAHLGPGLTATRVAAALGLSRFHFTRGFRGATGESPYRHIQRRRLEAARARVSGSDEALADIAYALGYASQGHMASSFSAWFGISPSALRALARGITPPPADGPRRAARGTAGRCPGPGTS
ncbi:MAG: AraC family transcriptional regulator [Gammaproteobacteria bacterium]